MLTSLIIAYFVLHGSASALMQQHIEAASKGIDKHITAEPMKKQALAIVDSAKTENDAFMKERSKLIATLKTALADRATTDAQLVADVRPFIAADSANASHLTDRIFDLRKVLTASDWAEVFPEPVVEKK